MFRQRDRERERQTERETDRETDRDRETERQRDTQTETETETERHRERHTHTEREKRPAEICLFLDFCRARGARTLRYQYVMLVRLRNAQHKSNAILQQNPFNCRWPLLPCAWKGCFRASPLRRALTLLAPNEKQKATLEAFAHLDLRVGEIKAVEKHPRADKLYIESIDVGKGESPRCI